MSTTDSTVPTKPTLDDVRRAGVALDSLESLGEIIAAMYPWVPERTVLERAAFGYQRGLHTRGEARR